MCTYGLGYGYNGRCPEGELFIQPHLWCWCGAVAPHPTGVHTGVHTGTHRHMLSWAAASKISCVISALWCSVTLSLFFMYMLVVAVVTLLLFFCWRSSRFSVGGFSLSIPFILLYFFSLSLHWFFPPKFTVSFFFLFHPLILSIVVAIIQNKEFQPRSNKIWLSSGSL